MNVGDVFLRLVPDGSRFRQDADAKIKAESAGLDAKVKLSLDQRAVRSFTSAMGKIRTTTDDAAGEGARLGGVFEGLSGNAMPALIGAGAALSPVIATLGLGLGGVALAAAGVARPIANAAGKTGGLAANMKLLNPEQRKVATGLLSLGQQYAAFEKKLSPVILGDFNAGLKLAGTLLRNVQPVAAATGKALGGALGQIDAEFRSGTWQQFFGFMARTAGPDMRLLSSNVVALMDALPPLLEALQPVAMGMLTFTRNTFQAIGAAARLAQGAGHLATVVNSSAKSTDDWTVSLTNHIPGMRTVNGWITSLQHSLTGQGSAAKNAGPKMDAYGSKVYV
ncbi:MAG: hypothetical protein ACRDNZ_16905, partial [Streptosporangiaceae bacterium]